MNVFFRVYVHVDVPITLSRNHSVTFGLCLTIDELINVSPFVNVFDVT